MACGCHRSYHKSVRVGELLDSGDDDLQISLSRIESVALNLMEATGRALPMLAAGGRKGEDLPQKELNTVMKISIENLDHISKVTLSTVECISLLQSAGNTTQQSANDNNNTIQNTTTNANTKYNTKIACADRLELRNLVPDHGRLSSEVSPVSTTERRNEQVAPSEGNRGIPNAGNLDNTTKFVNVAMMKAKRKRTHFTDEQRGKLKAYAEHAGWTIVGQSKDNIVAACHDIGTLIPPFAAPS